MADSAQVRDQLRLALPSFESYRTAHSKAGFSRPRSAVTLARGGWGSHLLDPGSIGLIESEDFR